MSNHQLHHREQPEAWSRLLSFADQASNDSPEPNAGASAMLAEAIDRLSGLELERNYTFGLGKIMCEMAIELQQEERRSKLINDMAIRLVLSAIDDRDVPFDQPFQPIINDLQYYAAFGEPLKDLAETSGARLLSGERILANSLTEVVRRKRPVRVGGAPLVQARAVDVVGDNAITGTTCSYQAYLIDAPIGQAPTLEQESRPIDPQYMATLAENKNFTPLSRLRLDEFLHGRGWKEGQCPMRFDTAVLKEAPPAVDYSKPDVTLPLRNERFGCEALFAGRLLIDIATDIFPRMIALASTIKPIDLAHRLIA